MQNLQLLYHIYHDRTLDNLVLEEKKHAIHVMKTIINERDRTDPMYRQLQDMINQYEMEFPKTISESDLSIFTKVVDTFDSKFRKLPKKIKGTPNSSEVIREINNIKSTIEQRLIEDKTYNQDILNPIMQTSAGPQVYQDFTTAFAHLEQTFSNYYSAESQSYLDAEIMKINVKEIIAGIKRISQSFYTKPSGFIFGPQLQGIANEVIAFGKPEQKQETLPDDEEGKQAYLLDRWQYSTKMKPLYDALTDFYKRTENDKDLAKLKSAVTKAAWTVFDSGAELKDKFFALDDLNELTPRSRGQVLRDVVTVIGTMLAAAALAMFFIATTPMTFATGNIVMGSSVVAGVAAGALFVHFGLFANNAENARRTAVSLSAMGEAHTPERPKPAEIASVPVNG